MNETVEIIEEPERNCRTCGVRIASAKLSESVGVAEAKKQRTPICARCEHHPNMDMARAFGGGSLLEKLVGKIIDNWRPITDDDKSCTSCKHKRTIDALGMTEDALKITHAQCLFCQYSKNAKVIAESNRRKGIDMEFKRNWVHFEE